MSRKRWLVGGGIAALGLVAALAAAAAAAVVVLVVAILVVTPMIAKPKIVAWLDGELDRRLAADVSFGDVSVSLVSSFPRLAVRVHDLAVVNEGAFEGTELVRAKEVGLALDLMSVVTGDQVRVRRISLIEPAIRIAVDRKGRTNLDAFMGGGGSDAGGGSSGGYALRLDDLTVQDLSLRIDDKQHKVRVRISDLDLTAKADFDGTLARVRSEAAVAGIGVRKGQMDLLRDARIDADVALDYDLPTGKATLGDNTVALNAMPLSFRGTVWPQEAGTDLDVAFETADTSFKALLSLVPAAFDDSFAGVDASGTIAVGGTVKGRYTSSDALPGFDVAVAVADGRFAYPGLPTSVDDVALDLRLHHPGGPMDALVIDVASLALEAAGAPVRAKVHVETPISDPDVAATVKGSIDLAALRSALPAAADAAPPSGRIDLDIEVAGKMSDFQAGNVGEVQAGGDFRGRDIRYVAEGWPELMVQTVDLTLGPQSAELREAKVTWDDSDVSVRGRIDGILPYLMADGVLSGRVAVQSTTMDLRPFEGTTDPEAAPTPAPRGKGKKGKGKPAPAPASDGAPMLVAVPPNVDLLTELGVGRLVTSSFEMRDVSGTIRVRDSAVEMDPLKARMLGGKVTLEGKYAAPTAERADVDVAITGLELDLAETVGTFATLRQIVPVLEGATGRYDSGLSLKMVLGPDGWPDLQTVASSGLFAPGGTTVRPAVLSSLRGSLGGDGFDSVAVAGTRIQYAFERGKLDLRPFALKLGTAPATLSGSVGVLDKKLNLAADVKVPTRLLKQSSPLLKDLRQAVGKDLDVLVKVTGTYDKPKLSVSLEGADVVDAIVDEVKDRVGEVLDDALGEARRQGDALVAAAEGEADKLRAEAKKQADKLRAEAKKLGDKLVADAKGNPVKSLAAKEAAKIGSSEADKAAKKVESEANKLADQAIAGAKAQRDKLLREAESRAKAATR
jgi:hypothetical protein